MARRDRYGALALASLALAALLTILPMASWLEWFRPYWMALMVIYWGIEAPEEIGLGGAFVAGLVLDLATGSLLGHHALSLVIIAYIVRHFRLRIRFFPLWQQALVVLAILLNDRLINLWILALSGQNLPDWRTLWPPFVALLVWPWLFLLLDEARRRARSR